MKFIRTDFQTFYYDGVLYSYKQMETEKVPDNKLLSIPLKYYPSGGESSFLNENTLSSALRRLINSFTLIIQTNTGSFILIYYYCPVENENSGNGL